MANHLVALILFGLVSFHTQVYFFTTDLSARQLRMGNYVLLSQMVFSLAAVFGGLVMFVIDCWDQTMTDADDNSELDNENSYDFYATYRVVEQQQQQPATDNKKSNRE